MMLLVDAGNTHIKWALVSGADWLCSGALPSGQADSLARQIDEHAARLTPASGLHEIRQIWASNVAGEQCALHIRNTGAEIGVEPHFIVAREMQCGVRNGYSTPSQLGSDRWAALIAAWHLVKRACLVVDTGTATTIDALSARGEFVGGLILPGVELMQRSLASAAKQLKPAPGVYAPFPQNSGDAICSGAIQASCGAIERQYRLLGDDSAPLLLSGGAAGMLLPYLDQKCFGVPSRIVDNLVLQGLLLIAREADCC
ncbi:MAG: type III pantothenate kinase [Gallionella sp.]